MVCKVKLENAGGDYTIVVPQQAIQISGQEKFVWIVKDGKAHRQAVTTGDVINEGVVVETGLTSGDVVIVEGQNKVSEDVKVRV
jgi:exopolysaccharide biosynthesis protein